MAPMTDDELAEIEAEFCPAPGVVREPSHGVPDLVAEVRRLTAALATVTAEHAAALDAARREGAEGMRERLAAIWDTRAAEHDATADRFRASRETDLAVDYERWAQRDRAESTAIRALPLDAPGGGS